MLRVTVEYIPYGQELRKETLELLQITNNGEGTPEARGYDVIIENGDGSLSHRKIKGHDRGWGWRPLVIKALEQTSSPKDAKGEDG